MKWLSLIVLVCVAAEPATQPATATIDRFYAAKAKLRDVTIARTKDAEHAPSVIAAQERYNRAVASIDPASDFNAKVAAIRERTEAKKALDVAMDATMSSYADIVAARQEFQNASDAMNAMKTATADPPVDPSNYSPEIKALLLEGDLMREEFLSGVDAAIRESQIAAGHYGERGNTIAASNARKHILELVEQKKRLADPSLRYTFIPPTAIRGWFTITQKIDDRNVLAQWGEDSRDFWIEGIDASSAFDGQKILLTRLMKEFGTKTFTTTLGASRTVRVLRIIDIPDDLQSRLHTISLAVAASDPGSPAPRSSSGTGEYHPQIQQRVTR